LNQHTPPPEDPADLRVQFLHRAVWVSDILDMMDRHGIRMTLEHADRIAQEQFNEMVLYLATLPLAEVTAKLEARRARMTRLRDLSESNAERVRAQMAGRAN
jgi:hypothetical protein